MARTLLKFLLYKEISYSSIIFDEQKHGKFIRKKIIQKYNFEIFKSPF